jgi:hypothetical protein
VAAMIGGLDAADRSQRKRPMLPPTRSWRALCLAAALVVLAPAAATGAGSASERAGRDHRRVTTTVLQVPADGPEMDPSEPHIAVDPNDPKRLFAVAQVGPPENRHEFLWRTDDGGKSWTRSPLLGGTDNAPDGIGLDPVVAAGGHGLVLYGTIAGEIDVAAGTATVQAGTRVSTDGGASFTDFGSADQATLPLCVIAGSCLPPPGSRFVDKPWLAIDTTGGAFSGAAYLVWTRLHLDTGQHEVLVAVSKDQGRTYGPPILLDTLSQAERGELDELAQVAVCRDGTIDVVWNGVRRGHPVILHAWSTDGGVSFSAAEIVVRLRPDASREGIVTSLAASPHGRLALCWQQARSPDRNDPRVACKVMAKRGRWGPQQAILPPNRDRQYLPAATFQGERLWVAAYLSSATSTRLVAVGAAGHHFGHPLTVNRWPIPSQRICAPVPPACPEGATFIGDYIGMVAAGRHLVVAYIQPSADPSEPNRVLVSSFGSG